VEIERGLIPYGAFSDETNEKSGLTNESIVYVEVEGSEPEGFHPHGFWFQMAKDGVIERFNTKKSWDELLDASRQGGTVHAPHTYTTFLDVMKRPFAISAFEVDGRYLGRMPDRRLTDDTLRLYGFDYSYLRGLRKAEARVAIEADGHPDQDPPRMEFRLLNNRCSDEQCVNLIVGNIALKPGAETSMVLGIGTQPLSDDYENESYQAFQQYALTYDQDGELTELVGQYGLGLVVVRRGSGPHANQYTLDLVAYERSVPLWRGVVDLKGGKHADRAGRDAKGGGQGGDGHRGGRPGRTRQRSGGGG
jgi:hypothetical protein